MKTEGSVFSALTGISGKMPLLNFLDVIFLMPKAEQRKRAEAEIKADQTKTNSTAGYH